MGLVVARTLAEAGATTFVCDIDQAAVEALPTHLDGAVVDVADAGAVDAWLEPIAAEGVDILVNNAGSSGPTAPTEDIDPSEWRRCLEVCLSGQFYCARRVIPTMKARVPSSVIALALPAFR